MSASWPTAKKTYTAKSDNVDDVEAAHINSLQEEIQAMQASMGLGKVSDIVQIVNYQTGAAASGNTAIPKDDTIPQNTEGVEVMTLAITPKDSTHKLKIDVVVNLGVDSSDHYAAALFQDSTANAIAAAFSYIPVNQGMTIKFTHYMTAGTSSATTFKVRVGSAGGGTIRFNGIDGAGRKYGGVLASSITITELEE